MHIAVVWLGLAWLALVCFVLFGWSHLWRCTVAGAGGVCAAVRWARPVNEELKRVANHFNQAKTGIEASQFELFLGWGHHHHSPLSF